MTQPGAVSSLATAIVLAILSRNLKGKWVKEIDIDNLLIFFLISSEFGEIRRGFLLASEAGWLPEGLDSTLGIITFPGTMCNVLLLVVDQTQVTRAFHKKASFYYLVRKGYLNYYVND